MMKLSSCARAFSPGGKPPYEESVRIIGEMGFKGVELGIRVPEDLTEYYTPATIKQLRDTCKSYNLEIPAFGVYTSAVEKLSSMVAVEREEAFDVFKRSVLVAKELGAFAVNLVTNWPYGIKAPHDYPPAYFNPWVPRSQTVQSKLYMELPDIDYSLLWDTYLDTMRACVAFVEEHGIDLYIEGHGLVIIGTTDGILRMLDQIKSDSLGVNFETAWHLIMREYLPRSIKKLGKKIKYLHLRDGDGVWNHGLPVGSGIIHWQSVFQALYDIGFDGHMALEVGGDPAIQYNLASKEYIEKVLAELGIN